MAHIDHPKFATFAGEKVADSYIVKLAQGADKTAIIDQIRSVFRNTDQVTHETWDPSVFHGFAGKSGFT